MEPTWVDKVTAVSALGTFIAAVISAIFVLRSIHQASQNIHEQNISRDIQTLFTLWERLDHHWARFKGCSEHSKGFEFGQLSSYYEIACGLFKDKLLSTEASRSLEEHLDEILPRMRCNEDFNRLFEGLMSDQATFSNIKWFCERKSIRIPWYQRY